jgi:acyl carrier protein
MRERVLQIVSQVLGSPVEEINEQSSPDRIEAWDSLRHMNLILALEEAFSIQFTDTQIMEMLSVKVIIETVTALTLQVPYDS